MKPRYTSNVAIYYENLIFPFVFRYNNRIFCSFDGKYDFKHSKIKFLNNNNNNKMYRKNLCVSQMLLGYEWIIREFLSFLGIIFLRWKSIHVCLSPQLNQLNGVCSPKSHLPSANGYVFHVPLCMLFAVFHNKIAFPTKLSAWNDRNCLVCAAQTDCLIFQLLLFY